MTTFFKKAEYAEDQKYAKTILTFHVLRSGAVVGAISAIPIALGFCLIRGPRTISNFNRILLISSSRGLVVGPAVTGVMLVGRMQGRDDIEWRDRSWRLLINNGQVEVDNWVLQGAAAGAILGFVAGRSGKLPRPLGKSIWTATSGIAALGTVFGTIGYLLWRHGVRGGKHE
jgi:hypothetical protein